MGTRRTVVYMNAWSRVQDLVTAQMHGKLLVDDTLYPASYGTNVGEQCALLARFSCCSVALHGSCSCRPSEGSACRGKHASACVHASAASAARHINIVCAWQGPGSHQPGQPHPHGHLPLRQPAARPRPVHGDPHRHLLQRQPAVRPCGCCAMLPSALDLSMPASAEALPRRGAAGPCSKTRSIWSNDRCADGARRAACLWSAWMARAPWSGTQPPTSWSPSTPMPLAR